MAALLSVLYWLIFVIVGIFFCVIAVIVTLATRPFNAATPWPHRNAALWSRTLVRINPAWHVKITGQEHVGPGPYVIVANHQSQMDILGIYFLRHHFKWIAKASLYRIPLIGWNMWMCSYIGLVRGDRESILRCMDEAESWIRRGVSVVFFPEGTRSEDGRVKAFKLGAFRLAADTGTPVLPIVISGTDRILPKGGWIFRNRATIRVHVEPPMPAPPPDQVEAFAESVRARIIARKAEQASEP